MIAPLGGRIIVDASVAIKWVVPETDSNRAIALRNCRLTVPDLFFAECANVLWRKFRLGDLTAEQARLAAETLEKADLTVIPGKPHLGRALAIAITLDHPAYDGMYLAIAEASGLKLVTADDRLMRKIRQPPSIFGHLALPLSELVA